MSLEDFRKTSKKCGNKYASIWEIQLERCTERHGEGGCNANSENEPCFGTRETCQSLCDFKCKNHSYFFTDCDDKALLDVAPNGFKPNVVSSSITAGEYKVCGGLPSTETQTITLQDGRSSDYFDDPYPERRTKSPKENGTGLEKWIQRNDIEGRLVRYYYGACGSSFPGSFIKRNYFIDSINGPSGDDCKYTLKLKDAFHLIHDDRRKVPTQVYNLKLGAPVLSSSSTLNIPGLQEAYEATVQDEDIQSSIITVCFAEHVYRVQQQPADINNAEGSIYKIIEKNVCGSKPLTGTNKVDKGQDVTIAKSWPKYTNVMEMAYDILFQDGVGIPSTQNFNFNQTSTTNQKETCDCGPFLDNLVDIDQIHEEMNSCGSLYFLDETVICEPESPRKLLDNISNAFLTTPFINDETCLVNMHVLRPPTCKEIETMPLFDSCNIIRGSFKMTRNRNERITQVETKAEAQNCAENGSDTVYVAIDKSNFNSGADNSPFISIANCDPTNWKLQKSKEIDSRFHQGCNAYQADMIGARVLYMRERPPISIEFEVAGCHLTVGKTDMFKVRSDKLQDIYGCDPKQIFIVNHATLKSPRANTWIIKAESTGFFEDDIWSETTNCTQEGECGDTLVTDRNQPRLDEYRLLIERVIFENCKNANLQNIGGEDTLAKKNPDFEYSNYAPSYIDDFYKCNTHKCPKLW
jgi:hypothetical protein